MVAEAVFVERVFPTFVHIDAYRGAIAGDLGGRLSIVEAVIVERVSPPLVHMNAIRG